MIKKTGDKKVDDLRRMIASLYSSKEGIAQLLNGGGERILLHAPEPKKGKRK